MAERDGYFAKRDFCIMMRSHLTYAPRADWTDTALGEPKSPNSDPRNMALKLAVYCEIERRWSMTQCQQLECMAGVARAMRIQMDLAWRVLDWGLNPCRAVSEPGAWSESDYAISRLSA